MTTLLEDQESEVLPDGFPSFVEFRLTRDLQDPEDQEASVSHDLGNHDEENGTHNSQPRQTPPPQQSTTAQDVNLNAQVEQVYQPPEGAGETTLQKKKPEPRQLVKYLPLAAWAVVLIIAATLITVHLVNASPEDPSSDATAMGTNTKFVNECLREIRSHFMGVDAYRLDVGSPQFSATEWLAVDDEVCAYLDLNSTRLEQRYALLTVYYALGSSESTLSGWDNEPGVHECDWANVACGETFDNVTSIRIGASESQDPGYLPEEIGLLSSLTTLEIVDSRMGGTLPIGLYSLTNLETLDLSGNKFISGSIPTWIGRLSNLKYLDLRNNVLTGTLSHEIASLRNLRHFIVRENDFSGDIWRYIESWPYLETFDVGYNRKANGTIPTEIGMVTNLKILHAEHSQTSGTLPTEMGNLGSLEWCGVYFAIHVNGSLPSEFGRLSSLIVMQIGTNDLEGTIPTEIGLCSSLEYMAIKQNEFRGTLPSELGLLRRLTNLDARENRMHGVIPETFERLTNLNNLDLRNNKGLVGEVPPGLCDIKVIKVDCNVNCTCCDDQCYNTISP